jgi:predicted RNA-binding protein with PIN domain
MATRLVIDGYNFICATLGLSGSHPGHMDTNEERTSLTKLLSDYRKVKKGKVTIVFDRKHGPGLNRERRMENGIEVIFARPNEEADDIIKEMAAELGPGLTVVTSDRAVRKSAERSGSIVLSSSEFYSILEEAEYGAVKGVESEDEEEEGPGFGIKKGPARKPSKKERKKRTRLKKL